MVSFSRRDILGGLAAGAVAATPAFGAEHDFTYLGLAEPPMVIDAPELDIPDLSGNIHKIEDYRGKIVVISFWATWCPPCRKEMPTLARLNRQLGLDRFAVLAVNVGDREDRVRDFLEKIDHDALPILLDQDTKLVSKWFIRGLPVTYLLDPKGRVIYGAIGERVWDSPAMISGLKSLS
ncbi:thioredoxin family protein [Stappia aggregata IAM 12614]|uniref:Thioredoxin family protein n=1 Tax=Roseibium aggregatum (strain ATCC 25650 / DSM 13394 / JCM 20685 / NBRC 16684 / NCIMB 2208 / IAM 12614 / B1) TaxID=384765 RepID=A0P186_ROSAI|nr:TlpA disulfide reductase family protein [Roseibium aggregatum]EAV41271.1 thioredoxin family protein [Stappia aggregata IAM 12614] [Roseibium aggregatum IAM 12614]